MLSLKFMKRAYKQQAREMYDCNGACDSLACSSITMALHEWLKGCSLSIIKGIVYVRTKDVSLGACAEECLRLFVDVNLLVMGVTLK